MDPVSVALCWNTRRKGCLQVGNVRSQNAGWNPARMSAGCSNIANPRNWSCLVKSTLKIHKQTPLAIYLNLRCYRCFPCKKEPLICHETRRFAAPAAPHPSCSAASHVYPELQSSARPLEQQIHCRQNLIPWFLGPKGRKLFGDFFLVWGNFFWFPVLTIFHAICSILELETAISTVCATVLSSNLSFSIVFSTVFATVCSMFCPFSMLFAAFLSWNLHFHRMCNILQLHSSQYLQDFGAEGWHSNSCLLLLLLLLVLVLVSVASVSVVSVVSVVIYIYTIYIYIYNIYIYNIYIYNVYIYIV